MSERRCDTCEEMLDRKYFRYPSSSTCCSCVDEARAARPWTDEQVHTLLASARELLDLCRIHVELWEEADQQRWRRLIDAIDRRAA